MENVEVYEYFWQGSVYYIYIFKGSNRLIINTSEFCVCGFHTSMYRNSVKLFAFRDIFRMI